MKEFISIREFEVFEKDLHTYKQKYKSFQISTKTSENCLELKKYISDESIKIIILQIKLI